MSDRILCISWGQPVHGREERAVEVFDESVGFYGRLQQDGRIDHFDVVILEPATGVGGWFALHGSAEQLHAVREDEEFRRHLVEAELIATDMKMCMGSTGEGIAREMAMYREAVTKVAQMA